MARTNRASFIRRDTLRSCEFVTDLINDGFVINLKGYPLRQIRIVQNRPNQLYSVHFTDTDGSIYKVKKVTEDGDLFTSNAKMVLEEVCT